MTDMKKLNKQVREKVIKEMEDNGVLNEAFLYTVPYDEFYLTQPSKENEVAARLENVILVAKEKIVDSYGKTKKFFELYDESMREIGVAETDQRFKADKEILESLLEDQQRKLDELQSGLKVAGADSLDNQGRIESYFELVNRKLTIMNKEQKEKYDILKSDYERDLGSIAKGDVKAEFDAKEKFDEKEREEIEKNNLNNKENAEAVKSMAEGDLGFEISKITPIEDDLFYDNNPAVERGRAFLVMDTKGRPQIICSKGGKFEKAPEFEQSTAEAGRTAIMRNDDTKIEEKNTYGGIRSSRHTNVRYTIELGTYGEPKLIEQMYNKGNKIEESYVWLSREVQTDNTDYGAVNREGNTVKNVTRETFKQYGYTDDSHPDSISEKTKKTQEDMGSKNESDFTPEDIANSIDMKVDNAMKKIKSELKEKNIEFTDDDEKSARDEIRQSLEDTDIIYCDDVVEQYCEEYVQKKEEEKEEAAREKAGSQSEGRDRLEEIIEMMSGRRNS